MATKDNIDDEEIESKNVAIANLILSSDVVAAAIATEVKSEGEPSIEDLTGDHILLRESGAYAAYGLELECLWRWDIYRDGSHIQTGCAISLDSAKVSVNHVLAFYGVRDANVAKEAAGVENKTTEDKTNEA
jgi:soluble methane monooxygenase-binding protein MmoD